MRDVATWVQNLASHVQNKDQYSQKCLNLTKWAIKTRLDLARFCHFRKGPPIFRSIHRHIVRWTNKHCSTVNFGRAFRTKKNLPAFILSTDSWPCVLSNGLLLGTSATRLSWLTRTIPARDYQPVTSCRGCCLHSVFRVGSLSKSKVLHQFADLSEKSFCPGSAQETYIACKYSLIHIIIMEMLFQSVAFSTHLKLSKPPQRDSRYAHIRSGSYGIMCSTHAC